MKRLSYVALALAIILFLPTNAYAQAKDQKVVRLPAGEFYDGDFYAFGDIIEISGTVDGDVYTAGGQVLIDGLVTGDVLAAGQRVNISGTVGQDARVASYEALISGEIGRNLSVAAFMVDVLSPATIQRNAQLIAENVNVRGNVLGDVVKYTNVPKIEKQDGERVARGINIFTTTLSLMSTLILGFLLIKLFPNYTKRATDFVIQKPAKSLMVGFAGLVLFPAAILAMFITIFAIPISFFTICIFVIYLFLTRIYVMTALGEKLTQITNSKISSQNWKFVLGLVVYYLLSLLPILGGIIKLLVLIAGFGAALMNEREMYKLARKNKIF